MTGNAILGVVGTEGNVLISILWLEMISKSSYTLQSVISEIGQCCTLLKVAAPISLAEKCIDPFIMRLNTIVNF